ncbi:MAG TPA: UvrB/UvrC motif-containing protein, partial [Alphaproteobacteria bacterium]|nr:UvrB/UvrC motif-containing protein [Alphaproteobacteria bacterium]
MKPEQDITSIEAGLAAIRGYVARLPETAGVYRMLCENGEVLYVGKAKALKRRVNSYTAIHKLPVRLKRMVALTRTMEFVHTHTEVEALLLEANLIKQLAPRFNILLRDDKSFPYLFIPLSHEFPALVKHRGAKEQKGDYFGPFASAGMVNRTLNVLQKAFQLRNCSDNVFAGRSRPCLQYHIKRCTAPCVGYVSREEYAAQVDEVRAFLSGKSRELMEGLTARMQAASEAMEFEKAAALRDRIRALQGLQAHQDINVAGLG